MAANLSPVPRLSYHLAMPRGGHWREVLNTDAEIYGGANLGNLGGVDASAGPFRGQPASAHLTLPPLATIWLTPDD